VHDDDHLAGVEVVFARVLKEEVFGDPLPSEGCVEEVMAVVEEVVVVAVAARGMGGKR
jgi:hypothetical protein